MGLVAVAYDYAGRAPRRANRGDARCGVRDRRPGVSRICAAPIGVEAGRPAAPNQFREEPLMPPTQTGQAYRLAPGKWGLRYYDRAGTRRRKSPFASKSAALAHYRKVIEPELRGEAPAAPALTLAELVELYLERHAVAVRPRTITTLRDRLRHAIAAFGDVPLRDLERMTNEIAGWRTRLPERAGHGIVQALRQVLDAAVRWELMARNPAKLAGPNRQPSPRTVRAFDRGELDALAAELPVIYRPLPAFAAATGLRPEEWQALERRDVDRQGGILTVRRTVSSGEVVELAKTERSRRQVPLSARASGALDAIPPRLDTPLIFPGPRGGVLSLDNFRRREWTPAVEASGVRRPARIYDLRSTFASNALAAGVSVFELARVMGTSIEMIERHYGTLLDGSGADIAGRLDALEAAQEAAADEQSEDV
jgi:integrase